MPNTLRPACMTDPEWTAWEAGNAEIPWPKVQLRTPCTDCLVPFYREMLEVGRCDGYPGRASLKPYTPERRTWHTAQVRRRDRLAAGVTA